MHLASRGRRIIAVLTASQALLALVGTPTHAQQYSGPKLAQPIMGAMTNTNAWLIARQQDNTALGFGAGSMAWTALSGTFSDRLDITAYALSTSENSAQAEMVGRSSLGHVLQRSWRTSSWGSWYDLGSPNSQPIVGSPAVTTFNDGKMTVLVFVRGSDNALYSKTYSNGWGNWVLVDATPMSSSPAVAANPSGNIFVFARVNNTLEEKRYRPGNGPGTGWLGWIYFDNSDAHDPLVLRANASGGNPWTTDADIKVYYSNGRDLKRMTVTASGNIPNAVSLHQTAGDYGIIRSLTDGRAYLTTVNAAGNSLAAVPSDTSETQWAPFGALDSIPTWESLQYITGMKLVAASSPSAVPACPAGYLRDGQDLNEGAGGDYVYLCVQRGQQANQALGGIQLVTDVRSCAPGDTIGNVNSGKDGYDGVGGTITGAKPYYMCVTRSSGPSDPDNKPIKKYKWLVMSTVGLEWSRCPSGWDIVEYWDNGTNVKDADFNETAKGKYIYMCLQR